MHPKGYGVWSENVYRYTLYPFVIRYGFWGELRERMNVVMNKKQVEICEFEMHLKNFLCLWSNLSYDDIISA